MNPKDVNPGNFTVDRIIYTDDTKEHFSIAVGTWNDDGTVRFAMRWNGDETNPDDKGYPKVFGNAMWFQLPPDLAPVLKALNENAVVSAKVK